jgi:hypothetical protein
MEIESAGDNLRYYAWADVGREENETNSRVWVSREINDDKWLLNIGGSGGSESIHMTASEAVTLL